MSPYAGSWSSRSCLGWGLGVPGKTVNEDDDEDEARLSSRGEGDRERSCSKDMRSYPSSISFTFHYLAFVSHDSFPYLSVVVM